MSSHNPAAGYGLLDKIESLGSSAVQHGKLNDRIYLMKLSKTDYPDIIATMSALADQNGYSKIVAKAPAWAKAGFEAAGYLREAHVPGFYGGTTDVYFMSKFIRCRRAVPGDADLMTEVLERTENVPLLDSPPVLGRGLSCRIVKPEEAGQLAELYKEVFESYPFPIRDPAYLRMTMRDNAVYFAVFDGAEIAAAASCEMDLSSKNAEMTDFATRTPYRAQGLASYLLYVMEQDMRKRGIVTVYTIARAVSFGMNVTFSRHGYEYGGTLVNNTNISGGLESMNVWYKTPD